MITARVGKDRLAERTVKHGHGGQPARAELTVDPPHRAHALPAREGRADDAGQEDQADGGPEADGVLDLQQEGDLGERDEGEQGEQDPEQAAAAAAARADRHAGRRFAVHAAIVAQDRPTWRG